MSLKLLLVSHLLINLTSLYFLIRDGSRPYRIWAWMMTIFALPVIGVCTFLLFGVNRRKRKLFDLKKISDDKQWASYLREYQASNPPQDAPLWSPGYQRLSRLIAQTAKSPLTYNNHIEFLTDGQETFDSIISACQNAKEFVLVQFYIFGNGIIADQLALEFAKCIERNVSVYLLVDAIGSWSLSKSYQRRLRKIGVQVCQFLPLRLGALGRTNYRNHRKIVVIDGHVGFTGGVNVDDKYILGDHLGPWSDVQVKITGEAVNFLQFIFYCDWYFASGENLFKVIPIKTVNSEGTNAVQIVASGPDSDHANILQEVVNMIGSAQDYVYIANPYLIPNESLMLALRSAALSGVDVRIVIPHQSDYSVTTWAVRSYFEPLLVSGVKIYLHQPGFLHAKIILCDDAICSVGTANLDIRSFEQNFEVNAVIYDQSTTLKLKQHFDGYMQQSQLIPTEEYMQRPRKDRIRENLARLVSPLM